MLQDITGHLVREVVAIHFITVGLTAWTLNLDTVALQDGCFFKNTNLIIAYRSQKQQLTEKTQAKLQTAKMNEFGSSSAGAEQPPTATVVGVIIPLWRPCACLCWLGDIYPSSTKAVQGPFRNRYLILNHFIAFQQPDREQIKNWFQSSTKTLVI